PLCPSALTCTTHGLLFGVAEVPGLRSCECRLPTGDSGCGVKPGTSSTQTKAVCACVARSFRATSTSKSRTTRRDSYIGGTRAPKGLGETKTLRIVWAVPDFFT